MARLIRVIRRATLLRHNSGTVAIIMLPCERDRLYESDAYVEAAEWTPLILTNQLMSIIKTTLLYEEVLGFKILIFYSADESP